MKQLQKELEGKVTIVTGSAKGIGKAIAQRFAREDTFVIIMDMLEDEGQKAIREIESEGGKALLIKMNAGDGQEVIDSVQKAVAQKGRIDILINNIGFSFPKPFIETDEEYWRKHLDLNLMTTLRFSHAVLPHMIKQQYGRIVNISSVQGRRAASGAVVYGAAKAAIISVTRSLAQEYAKYNIRVNAICPGPIETDVVKRLMANNREYIEAMLKESAMGRTGKPEEIASIAYFLCSDDSSFMTGQSLIVDGGMIML